MKTAHEERHGRGWIGERGLPGLRPVHKMDDRDLYSCPQLAIDAPRLDAHVVSVWQLPPPSTEVVVQDRLIRQEKALACTAYANGRRGAGGAGTARTRAAKRGAEGQLVQRSRIRKRRLEDKDT